MRPLLIILALAASLAAQPAHADKGGRGGGDDDRVRVEEARERGAIMPIESLLALLREEVGGEIVEIEVDDDDGHIVYEVYYLDGAGRRHEIKVDAATGAILEGEADD
jgi:uncharacterized membrane protein YkoI